MPRVLIVEDDPGIAHLLGTLLRFEGYEVQQTKEQDAVVSAVEQSLLDLAIIDVHLREGDGFDVLRRIRELPDERAARTPVLMMSGMDYRHQCRQAGANGFLEKPFDRRMLLDALNGIALRAAADAEN